MIFWETFFLVSFPDAPQSIPIGISGSINVLSLVGAGAEDILEMTQNNLVFWFDPSALVFNLNITGPLDRDVSSAFMFLCLLHRG